MKAIHKKRLLKLANHLSSGKLGHKKFDFSLINGDFKEFPRDKCGTCGCAWGEGPIVFPRLLRFRQDGPWGAVFLKSGSSRGSLRDAEIFFGLTSHEKDHVFHPDMQDTVSFGGKDLTFNATAKQVAANIEAFVKRKEKEA